MSVIDNIWGLLSRKRRIDRISVEQLRREKIRVEQMEGRVQREVGQIEARKETLFRQGTDDPSARQRVAIAHKIKELDSRAQAKSRQAAFFSKHLRIIHGLLQIKENMALLKELRLGSIISKMPVEELTRYVEKACVEGQFEMEKFASMLSSLEAAGAEDAVENDPDISAIVAAMEQARAAEEAGDTEGVTRAAEQMNQTLDSTREPAVTA